MKTICVVIGTRAQLIKTAPVMQELQRRDISYYFIYTAQHRETIEELLHEFGLKPPDFVLVNWEQEAKSILLLSSWVFRAFGRLLTSRHRIMPFRDGLVLVHGDTISTVWGALAGRLTANRVMHVESGLRSFNIFHPFPEELCRLITFRLSHVYACPGDWAVENLRRYRGVKLNTQQNTLLDAVNYVADRQIDSLPVAGPYVVVSIHRFENIFNKTRLKEIVALVGALAKSFQVIFVLHPSTKRQLLKTGFYATLQQSPGIVLQDRVPYGQFIGLIAHSEFVITDGGSNQEELSYLGVPALLLRKATERTEGLGANIVLSAYDVAQIAAFVENYETYRRPKRGLQAAPSAIIVDWIEAN